MTIAMDVMVGEDSSPFVGRRAFTYRDQEFFFGRSREARELSALWRDSRLVTLHGPPGSGKTSLLQAGLLSMVTGEADVLPPGRMLAASAFPEGLLAEYNPHSLAVLASWSPAETPDWLARKSVTEFLRCRSGASDFADPQVPLLVAIDQVEQVFTADWSGPARDDFFTDLATAMRQLPLLRVLLVTRTDLLSELLRYEEQIAPGGARHYALAPLTFTAAVEVAQQAVGTTGRRLTSGAARALVGELGWTAKGATAPVVEPVQLQVVCSALWRALPAESPVITVDFVRRAVDVDGALAAWCADAVAETSARHGVSAQRLFDWLRRYAIAPQAADPGEVPAAGMDTWDRVLRTLENQFVLRHRPGGKAYKFTTSRLAEVARRYPSWMTLPGSTARMSAADRMRIGESALAEADLAAAEENATDAASSADADVRLRADAWSLLGNIAYRGGRTELAARRYQNAAQLREQLGDSRGVARLFGAIGRMHSRAGRFTAALEELNAALSRLPDDLTLQTELATALWHSGQAQAAVAMFGAVLAVEPHSAEALAGRGQILSERGNAAVALADLRALLELYPASEVAPAVRSAYALALARAGHQKAALAEADAALAAAGESGVVLLRAAQVAAVAGSSGRASELLRRAEQASHPALSHAELVRAHRLRQQIARPWAGTGC